MAGEVVLLYVIVAIETTMLLGVLVVLRLLIWPMYVKTRNECAAVEERLHAALDGRDGWREVAERSLVVAMDSRGITQRAARLVAKANGQP